VRRRIDVALLLRSMVAGIVALPSVVNQYYILHHNAVFYQRALQATTLTPTIDSYIIGFGFILILALAGIRSVAIPAVKKNVDIDYGLTSLVLICWAVAGLTIVYAIPLAFQRKLIMGEQIPLSVLAALGWGYIAQVFPTSIRRVSMGLVVLLTLPSTIVFVLRDYVVLNRANTMAGSVGEPYLSKGEDAALNWISKHTKEDAAVLAAPRMSLLIPGYADRTVWAGHWGETPKCADKEGQLSTILSASTSDRARRAFLRKTPVTYLCYPNNPAHRSLAEMTPSGVRHRYVDLAHNTPAYLHTAYRNNEYTVFTISHP